VKKTSKKTVKPRGLKVLRVKSKIPAGMTGQNETHTNKA